MTTQQQLILGKAETCCGQAVRVRKFALRVIRDA